MISINLDDKNFVLTVKGHALEAEGPDHQLICNSVSVIVQGLAYSLTKFEKDRDAMEGFDYRPDEGDLYLKIMPVAWAQAVVRKRMQIYGDALEMLAICEPKYIEMTWNGEEIKPQKEEESNE